jgi:ATP-binding cassette subfamily C protein CydCD
MFNRRLWQAAKQSRLWLILTIVLSGLGGVATIVQAYFVSRTVDEVFLAQGSLADVRFWLAGLLVVIGVRAGLSWGREISANRIAIDVQLNLREKLMAHLLAMGPVRVYGEQTGELTAVLTEGIDRLEKYFSEYLPQLFIAVLVPLIILVVVFPLDWISGLILLFTAPLIPFFMVLIGRYAEKLTQRQWILLSRMSAHFLDVLQGLTTLKLLGQSKAQAKNIERITDRFRQVTMRVLQVAFLSALVLELLSMLSIAIIAVSIGLRLMVGGMAFSVALFILILAPEFYLPLRMLGQRFHAGMEGTAAADRIFGLLDTPIEENRQESTNYADYSFPKPIRFDRVGVTYQGREHPALHEVSFTLTPGKVTALVGASGGGKSTIANLLLRFVEPQSGQILIDEAALDEMETAVWRERIAWVPQQPYLFPESIAANIRLGKPDATEEQVVTAAKQAQLHEFILSLPQGYDSLVGERGARLSGGQAQRLALARAFLKDAPFIILDEPTSQLDSDTEMVLQAAIREHLADKMLLVIAHRLETVRQADEILVLENGRLIEKGSHEGLLKENGRYAQLVSEKKELTAKVAKNAKFEENSLKRSPVGHEKRQSEFGTWATIARLLKFVAPYKKWVALSVLLGSLAVGSGVALLATSAYLISAAALQPDISALSVAIVGVRFFGLARGVFRYLERLVSHNVTFKVLARLRVWFYEALEPLAPARLQQIGSGELLSRIVSDVDTLENFYIRVVSPPLTALVVGGVFVLYTAVFQPLLAAILLIFLLLAGLGVPLLIRHLSQESGHALVQIGSNLKEIMVDIIQGMADLEAFNAINGRFQSIRQQNINLAHEQRKMARITGFQIGLSEFLTFGAMWCVLAAAVPLIGDGQMNGVFMATAILATFAAFEAVQPLPAAAQYLDQSLAAARRLFAVVDTKPEVSSPIDPLPLPESLHFQFKETSFQYKTAVLPTLSNVNLDLQSGKKIGIVGPSGSGKSTLLNLLLRFWDWDMGEILLNGRSLRQYNPDDTRACFSVVSQRAHLFNASIYDNLRLANPQAEREVIVCAAKQAQLHDFVSQLPDGYQTQVGSLGRQLSGGEQRRLTIAQAILKDAPILILDEPTANLDLLTEKQVMKTLLTLAEKRTLLLVTHRPVGLQQMDEVWRIENGRCHRLIR